MDGWKIPSIHHRKERRGTAISLKNESYSFSDDSRRGKIRATIVGMYDGRLSVIIAPVYAVICDSMEMKLDAGLFEATNGDMLNKFMERPIRNRFFEIISEIIADNYGENLSGLKVTGYNKRTGKQIWSITKMKYGDYKVKIFEADK